MPAFEDEELEGKLPLYTEIKPAFKGDVFSLKPSEEAVKGPEREE